MTKQCIKETLQLMKNYMDEKSIQKGKNNKVFFDYYLYGKSVAYKDASVRLKEIIDKI